MNKTQKLIKHICDNGPMRYTEMQKFVCRLNGRDESRYKGYWCVQLNNIIGSGRLVKDSFTGLYNVPKLKKEVMSIKTDFMSDSELAAAITQLQMEQLRRRKEKLQENAKKILDRQMEKIVDILEECERIAADHDVDIRYDAEVFLNGGTILVANN